MMATLILRGHCPWQYSLFFLSPRIYKVKRNPRCLMCQHVIVDFCLTFHSGQELLISSLIICRYHQCRHNLCVIMVIIVNHRHPHHCRQDWNCHHLRLFNFGLRPNSSDGDAHLFDQKKTVCRNAESQLPQMYSAACLRVSSTEKKVLDSWRAIFFCKNQLPRNLHNDEWVVWSTRKLILWSFISSLGNLPKIALRNISHPGTERNMVGGVE